MSFALRRRGHSDRPPESDGQCPEARPLSPFRRCQADPPPKLQPALAFGPWCCQAQPGALEWPCTAGGVGEGGLPPPGRPPPPPQTKVTIVANNEIWNREDLVGPFSVHKRFGPRPPPPPFGLGMDSVRLDAPGHRHGPQPRLRDGRPPEANRTSHPGAPFETTKTFSGPRRVRMSSGERPMGAARGKQSDTEALCQTPPFSPAAVALSLQPDLAHADLPAPSALRSTAHTAHAAHVLGAMPPAHRSRCTPRTRALPTASAERGRIIAPAGPAGGPRVRRPVGPFFKAESARAVPRVTPVAPAHAYHRCIRGAQAGGWGRGSRAGLCRRPSECPLHRSGQPETGRGRGRGRGGGRDALEGKAPPKAVRQAVGGGCQSGWGRLLSVTNAIEPGTGRQGDSRLA